MTGGSRVRVRFAPSPTGNLHIGGLRTALFNFLFARHHNGTFLIRIEDTDRERSREEYVQSQLASLTWAGITSDEPLVYQSQRTDIYNKVLDDLFARNKIYRCTCTAQDLEERVRAAGVTDNFYKYDEHCRTKNVQADCGKPFAIRFALPKDQIQVTYKDLIYGDLVFEIAQLDDFIIIRSDGTAMYNFVVIVDDHAMNISHVIRGADHIPNTPKQILLYQACGYDLPQFGHIPLIINASGTPMSKRDGAVDVLNYKADGYISDAFVNYIVRLGWAYGDQEIFSRKELIDCFTLDGVGKKAAVFDVQKLQWLNGVYLKELSGKDLCEHLFTQMGHKADVRYPLWQSWQYQKACDLYKERVKTGKELMHAVDALYRGPALYNEKDYAEWITHDSLQLIATVADALDNLVEWTAEEISQVIKALSKEHDLKLVAIAQPLRIALLGCTASPGVFDIVALLGKTETLLRIKRLQEYATH